MQMTLYGNIRVQSWVGGVGPQSADSPPVCQSWQQSVQYLDEQLLSKV